MTVAQSVARNSLVQLAGRGVTMTLTLGTLSLLSRYLGPEEFGKYQFVIAFLLLVNVSDFGVSTLAVRHLSTDERDPRELLGSVVAVRTCLALLSTIVAISIAVLAGYPAEIQIAIAVAALSFPLMIAAGAYGVTFAAHLRMEYSALGNIAQAVVTLGMMVTVAWRGGGIIELLLAYNAGVLANSVVCWWFARRFVRAGLRFDGSYSWRLLRESAPVGIAILLISAYGRLDILLLRAITDDETVGYYAFSYRVVDLAFPLSFIFVGSVYPLLSRYHAQGESGDFARLYRRSHDVLSVGAVAIITGVVLFAEPITRVVGGSAYQSSVVTMQILVGAVGLIWLSNLADHGLVAIGRQTWLIGIALVGLTVNVAANLVLIPAYGGEGAAIATLLTEGAVLVPAALIVARYTREAPSLMAAARMLPVALLAAVVVYALPLNWVAESVIVAVLFGIGVLAMRVTSIEELRTILGQRWNSELVPVSPSVGAGVRR